MPNKLSDGDLEIVASYEPQTATGNNATIAGVAVDLGDCADAIIEINAGAHGDTTADTGFEIGLKHGDDTVVANHTDVAADELSETVSGSSTISGIQTTGIIGRFEDDSDSRIITSEYKGDKRYVSAYIVADGNNANGMPVAVSVIKSRLNVAPTTTNKTS